MGLGLGEVTCKSDLKRALLLTVNLTPLRELLRVRVRVGVRVRVRVKV